MVQTRRDRRFAVAGSASRARKPGQTLIVVEVNTNSEDQDLEACIFPDRSSIDSWGLTYHAAGIVRGIDLTTVMRHRLNAKTTPQPGPQSPRS